MKRPWLAPLVPLYAAGVALRNRNRQPAQRLRWPVISIGNLSTGGAGKTPLTIALAQLLTARGIHVDVLSRGYGRQSSIATKVDGEGGAEHFGDEPLLIARAAGAPVYVAPQRYDAGVLAEADAQAADPARQRNSLGGHVTSAHILDDGFQHRQLHRDVDILLLNEDDLNDTLLPAGNLREALHAAERAHVIAIPSDDITIEAQLRARGLKQPIWKLRRRMSVPHVDGPVFAFCGIARPEQFFSGLEANGLRLAGRKAFPDHYPFTDHVAARLVGQARATGASALITTEKDLVRLGSLVKKFPADLPILTAGLTTEIEDSVAAIDWLLSRLSTGISAKTL